jgi:hypothetical protein
MLLPDTSAARAISFLTRLRFVSILLTVSVQSNFGGKFLSLRIVSAIDLDIANLSLATAMGCSRPARSLNY